ncbi:cytochrome P450 [Actinoplanes sp. LDG1-06]|uniref:Cytochrome P450 n=1 Tax=Paractinoplanes ovalisporus TaxID=2810368 RepID=A0ABS2AQE6_9ACTN|nr:cytochrome P450 [Actinoplanes ovalisporus]MBM2622061.1 cytochrome P450 [Actinoplanes ovalisporus]
MTTSLSELDAWGDFDRDDPFPLFAQVRSAGPVHEVTLADGHRAWLVAGYEEARAALSDPRLSKDMHAALAHSGEVVAEGLPGPALARHMLAVDPPDHTRLRRLAMPAFSKGRIDGLEARVRAISDRLLDALERRGGTARPVDLVAGYAFPLPFTVISELLGIPEGDRADLGGWFRALLDPHPGPAGHNTAVAASRQLIAYLGELIELKRRAPGVDLVTDLVVAADRDGALTEQEMASTIFQLVVAGHDTTTSLIGNGTVALLRHPVQRDALVADPSLVPRLVEECLRWDAPVPHSTFRYTTEEVRLGGAVIPAYAQVIVSLAAANRDPARFRDAESFDPDRSDAGHLAFGHGIHHCLGAPLARLEGRIALGALHRSFPAMRLAVDPADLHWNHGDGLVLRGLTELPVLLGPRAA